MTLGNSLEEWQGRSWKSLKVVVIDSDADGIFAYLMALLTDPDGKVFPGLKQAPVVIEPDELVLERKYGKLLDGLEAVAFDTASRRPFDHHPPEDYPGECAVKNVAVVTGRYEADPVIQVMADQASQWDNFGGGDVFVSMNRRFKRLRNDPRWRTDARYRAKALKQALDLARELFEDWHYWQRQMHDPSLREVTEISSPRGLKGCIIHSDNVWARDVLQREGFALIAQITSQGEAWIRGNRHLVRSGVALPTLQTAFQDVLCTLRADIARPRGIQYDQNQLLNPGQLEGCEEVYHHERGMEIYIGGNLRKTGNRPNWDADYYDKVLTVAITLALDPGRFPKCCPATEGEHGCIGNQCGIYLANLPRCADQGRT